MRNRAFFAFFLISPSLAFSGFVPTYTLTDLGIVPGSAETLAGRLNDSGQMLGTAVAANDKGILFSGKKIIDIAPAATTSSAEDVNAVGEITGWVSGNQSGQFFGFLYRNGHLATFAHSGARQTLPQALNDLGQVAGEWINPTATVGKLFILQPNGTFADLATSLGPEPEVLAINDQGRVLIGDFDTVKSIEHAYISRPGSMILETIPSLIPGGSNEPGDMNQFGAVVGSSTVDSKSGDEHAYVYFQGKIADLGVLPDGDMTEGKGINNLGQTCGAAFQFEKTILDSQGNVVRTIPDVFHAWVNVTGTMLDLNNLVNASGKGWVINIAQAINDRGQIMADANFNNGPTHAVLLTPNAIMPAITP